MKQTLAIVIGLAGMAAIAADVPGYVYWSSGSLKSYEKKLAPKIDANKVASQPLGNWGNHLAMIAHREGDGEAELHAKVVDFFLPQGGEATLIVGGTIVEPRDTGPGEVRGKAILGGTKQKIVAGDVIRIPQNTPHQVLVEQGKQFTYFVIKVNQ
jgi:mannose-6-phosphate isomerase-like protein (cupin superfamily)